MAYMTMSELRSFAPSYVQNESRTYIKAAEASASVTVFLSHSHEDKELVKSFLEFLARQKVFVYVDWLDSTMPRETSAATARRVKERIGQCQKFIELATNQAIVSRWVPWELGVADTKKTLANIAIQPVTPEHGEWKGREYVAINSRIEEYSDGRWDMFPSDGSNGTYLEEWLSRK